MYKLRRSDLLKLELVAGIVPDSDGLARARQLGYETCTDGIEGVLRNGKIKLVFDATSARSHLEHAPRLEAAGIIAIDLTPAAVGPSLIPVVNMPAGFRAPNVNLVSCGAQATVPIVAAINSISPVTYGETVSTIASLSAGLGTRHNIDEFTRTTARSVHSIGGAKESKSIIVLNPANPPIVMRNTVYAQVDLPADEKSIHDSVMAMAEKIKSYVPGYKITVEPFLDGDHITTCIEVTGAGDYLPPYAGNLDIITSVAVYVAECYAKTLMKERMAING
jgi:acetaldehyde dehydrogenase